MGRSRTRRRAGRASSEPARAALWPRLAALLAATFAIKLIVLVQLQAHPLLQPDAGLDTTSYVHLARRVVSGDITLGPGLYYLSPLYLYFLASALALSDSFTFVRVLQIALGTAAVGCIFLTARMWYGERAGWIAAGLAALTGVFTFYEIVILQSALDTSLTAAALWCLTQAVVGPPPSERGHEMRAGMAVGVLFGLQILNRPNVAIAVIGLVVVFFAVRRPRLALVLLAGALTALVPVVARNALVSHQFALVSSQGGLNFYIGNRAEATGQYAAVPGVQADIEGQSEDTRRVAEQAVGHAMTDAEVSSYFTHLALNWIREHPGSAIKLFGRKLALAFNARHQWLDFSYPYYAYDTGSWLWMLCVGPWLLVPLGLAGLVFGPAGRRAAFFAWAAFVPLYAIGVALFFVAERYRLPLFVPLCVTAAGAVENALFGRISGPAPRTIASASRLQGATPRLAALAALVVAGGLLTFWPFHLGDGRFEERLRLSKVLMNRGDYGGAVGELEAASRLEPTNTVVEFNLGMALLTAGRATDGIPHLRHAVDAGVPIKGARYALANALLTSGDIDGGARLIHTFAPGPEDDAESCLHVAMMAINTHSPDVAERYLRRALELRPDWPEARQLLQTVRGG